MNATPLCLYCGVINTSKSREHVPTKKLLEVSLPVNMRVIPSCTNCNSGWSEDEEYLINFLAQTTKHNGLQKRIHEGGNVDRAFSNMPSKENEFVDFIEVSADHRWSIEADIERISRVSSKLAFGLYCLEYGVGKSTSDFSTVWVSDFDHDIPLSLRAAQWGAFGGRRKAWTIVQDGVFSFFANGSLASDPPSYCFLNFYDTLFVAICGPHLVGRTEKYRLRSKPWSTAN